MADGALRAALGAYAVLLAGCVGLGPAPDLPRDVPELTETPFYPQTDYDCGPAALATILNAVDVGTSPAELIDAVYIEGLEGSLQAELLAATRRYGMLPVPVAPEPDALFDEVASGRPVLVLQNLGLERAPRWHYAVVIGFEADAGRVILRSGTERRRLERSRWFMRSWRLADHWGFVAVRPGEIPASATPDRYMRALVGAERQLGSTAAAEAYEAALARWPDDPLVLFLDGVRAHSAEDWATAVDRYRAALAREPAHVAARNNLAEALLEQGCRAQALREARTARKHASAEGEFAAAVADTLRRVEQSAPDAPEPAVCGQG